VYSVFVVFFGTFGSCIPLVGDRTRGWSEKVLLTGYDARRWLAERLAAGAAIDTVQLAPVLVLLLLVGRTHPAGYGPTVLAVALALLTANAVGSVIARLVSSVAEAALACSTAALFALHFSGVFRTPVPGGWGWRAERVSPFRPLAEAMDNVASGVAGAHVGSDWLGPLVVAAATLVLALSLAPGTARSAVRSARARPPNRRTGRV
jgi:hypothetical protein